MILQANKMEMMMLLTLECLEEERQMSVVP